MRAQEFVTAITEAPLVQYDTIGDFDRAHGFRHATDRKLVTNPVNIQKLHSFFENTPFDFRIFAVNKRGAGKYQEHGVMSYDQFESIFGDKIANQVYGDPDNEEAITIAFVGNSGDDRVMLTPWMMAHRFGHAIQATHRFSQREQSSWSEAESFFFSRINEILNTVYSKKINPRFRSRVDYENPAEYNALFNAIGTMRSARSNRIKRPYEFFYELFAQYLQSGEIKFNALPQRQSYGRQAWGRPTKQLYARNDIESANEDLKYLAQGLEDHFEEVLRAAQGQVYVM